MSRFRLIPIFQILFILATSAFISLAYKHHSGNKRFVDYYHTKQDEREASYLVRRLLRNFPEIESASAIKSPDRHLYHLYEAKQKGKESLIVARMRKELSCKDCRTIDFLVVLDPQNIIQLVKLMDPILITGKAINPDIFLQQFKGKQFKEPIQIGKDIEIIKDAPESSEAMIKGVSEIIDFLDK